MSRMTGEQIADRLVDKFVDVINDQRKKDAKTGRSLTESNASALSALTIFAAQLIVNIAPPEHVDGACGVLDQHVRAQVKNIIQSNLN